MPKPNSRSDRLNADSVPPTLPSHTSTPPEKLPRTFPAPFRVEPIAPFSERWKAKLADHQLFVSLLSEFASLCEANGIYHLPDELLADWHASWAKNTFEGFLLPQHPTLPRSVFESAVSSIATFSNAYRYIFPNVAHPDAKRFWFYQLPCDHGQDTMPNAEDLWRLMPELRLRPGAPIDPWPHGRLDQRQFFDRASVFLNSPTPEDWQWLRRLAWATDPNQRIWGQGVPQDRWARMLRVSVPIVSGGIGIDCDPRIVESSTPLEVLVVVVENWCRNVDTIRQSPAGRTSDGSNDTCKFETIKGEGEKPNGRAKGAPLAEAEIRVSDWLVKHAKDNPAGIKRDAVAAGTHVSAGQVSNTAAWKAFRQRRDEDEKSTVREVPLTNEVIAVVPGNSCAPDELASLIEEQRADEAEDNRRHKPS